MKKKLICIGLISVFLLLSFSNITVVGKEVSTPESSQKGTIYVAVWPLVGSDFEICEETIVEVKDRTGKVVASQEVQPVKGYRATIENLEINGLFESFFLSAHPAKEGYVGTKDKCVTLASYMTETSTMLHVWKPLKMQAHTSFIDLFSAFPLLQRILQKL